MDRSRGPGPGPGRGHRRCGGRRGQPGGCRTADGVVPGSAGSIAAKARGARVVTTVGGSDQAARVRDLGADLAINYRTEDFVEHGPYNVILDVIGGHHLQRNVHYLAPDGRLVVIGLQNGLEGELNLAELLLKRASVHGTTLRSRPTEQKAAIVTEVQEHVWPLIESGSVQPVIDRALPMSEAAEAAEAAEAHRILDAHHIGKIVLGLWCAPEAAREAQSARRARRRRRAGGVCGRAGRRPGVCCAIWCDWGRLPRSARRADGAGVRRRAGRERAGASRWWVHWPVLSRTEGLERRRRPWKRAPASLLDLYQDPQRR